MHLNDLKEVNACYPLFEYCIFTFYFGGEEAKLQDKIIITISANN